LQIRDYYTLDETADELLDAPQGIPDGSHVELCPECECNHFTGRCCDGCGGKLKDTIINFGDQLGVTQLEGAKAHATASDLMLSLGTTMLVTPANEMVTMGKRPVRLVVVNRQTTKKDRVAARTARVFGDIDVFLRHVMAQVMPAADRIAWEEGRATRMRAYDLQRAAP